MTGHYVRTCRKIVSNNENAKKVITTPQKKKKKKISLAKGDGKRDENLRYALKNETI